MSVGSQHLMAGGQSPAALLLPPQRAAFKDENVFSSPPLATSHKALSIEGLGVAPLGAPREFIPVSGLAYQPHTLTG